MLRLRGIIWGRQSLRIYYKLSRPRAPRAVMAPSQFCKLPIRVIRCLYRSSHGVNLACSTSEFAGSASSRDLADRRYRRPSTISGLPSIVPGIANSQCHVSSEFSTARTQSPMLLCGRSAEYPRLGRCISTPPCLPLSIASPTQAPPFPSGFWCRFLVLSEGIMTPRKDLHVGATRLPI